jgi:hypothetical protein
LSTDAVHDSEIDVWPTELVDNPDGVEGGVVSGHADVCCVTVAIADTFPAASTAVTPSVYDVPQLRPENVKLVPDAVPTWLPPR